MTQIQRIAVLHKKLDKAIAALKIELQNLCDADGEDDQEHIDELDKLIHTLEKPCSTKSQNKPPAS